MKAPLLILFDENGTHTVHGSPNQPAHLAAKEAQAQTKGLKLSGYAVPRGLPKANFYVTHPADEPAHMPTRKELRAILKEYRGHSDEPHRYRAAHEEEGPHHPAECRQTRAGEALERRAKGIELSNVDFISTAFAGMASDEVPWVAGVPGDVAKAPHSVWFGAPAIPLPRFIRADSNSYICVSTFDRAEDGKYRRRKNCWSGLHMVLLDDLNSKVPFTALRLAPSCLVETSPGNFQAWLLLKQPERDQTKAEALINGLIAAGASDPGAGNLTRYGRLPTGINGKAKYHDKNGKPFSQRVHGWAPERRYTPEQIAQAYGFDLAAASKPRAKPKGTKPATANRHVEVLDAAGLYIRPITSMHGAHQIICPWWEQHTDKDQSGTIYFEPHEQNGGRGGFKCQHGHCAHRSIADLDYFILTLQRRAARAAA